LQISIQKNKELFDKGVDTKRLSEIDSREVFLNSELKFIEDNTPLTIEYQKDIVCFSEFQNTDCYKSISEYFGNLDKNISSGKRVKVLIDEIKSIHYEKLHKRKDELRNTTTDFLGKFSENNIFKFKKQIASEIDLLGFAEMLSDFVEERKIERIEKEVNERFALIVSTVGTETGNLLAQSGEIQKIITKINNDFIERESIGAGVIKKIELKIEDSKNEIVQLLLMIKKYNDYISLSDSFELKFRIEENQNDTGWQEKLTNVGSEGTYTLVKAMVNIMLLNVFKERVSKRFKNFRLHCMMDEIGKLHPTNVRGILKKQIQERNKALIYCSNPQQMNTFLQNNNGIYDLQNYINVLQNYNTTRAELVAVASNSKSKKIITFTGFLVNSFEPIQAAIDNEKIKINPIAGTFQFIYDFESFTIPQDITIVGVENHENFRHIEKQKYLFE
jgi:hypothetical protein